MAHFAFLRRTAACAAVALLACTALARAETLKLGHITPPSHVWHQVAEKIAADLDKASGGKMTVAVSPLQKLGNEAQMIQLMQSGAQQLGVFTVGALSNREEALLGWSLPYAFRDVAHASRAASTPAAQAMLRRLEPHGLVGLGYAFAGMRHVLSVQPVASTRDLAGKKLRSFPSPIYNDWWTANGAAPTAMTLSEIGPSLVTRLLDAVDVDLDALVGMKFHHQAPYLTLTGHMAFPAVIVASKVWWDRLGEADRRTIAQVVQGAEQWGWRAAIDADVRNLDQARADGARLVDADLDSLRKVAGPVRDKYIARNALVGEFYQQVQGR